MYRVRKQMIEQIQINTCFGKKLNWSKLFIKTCLTILNLSKIKYEIYEYLRGLRSLII